MTEHTIVIEPEAFDQGFDVRVTPPTAFSLDREFATAKQARGYASGLKMVHGWKVLDLIGGDA